MDASFVPTKSGTDEALAPTCILNQTYPSPFSKPLNSTEMSNQPIKLVPKPSNTGTKHVLVSTEYIKHNGQIKSSECTIQDSKITQQQKALSSIATPVTQSMPVSTLQSTYPELSIMDKFLNTKNSDHSPMQNNKNVNFRINSYSVRSVSSPQLTTKPLTRSKVYRKASLKSSMNSSNSLSEQSFQTNNRKNNILSLDARIINISNCTAASIDQEKIPLSYPVETDCNSKEKEKDSNETKNKWNMEDMHITCNPLSTPYPYSTPHHNTVSETMTEPLDDEPKSRSCGSFLPILSLIPQTVSSFQYLSPKMKFSWWRNKIS